MSEDAGYLSSQQASDTGCGTARCPWYIDVSAGQRINVTLFDFGPAASVPLGDACHWYCVIYDGSIRKEVTRCQDERQRFEYVYTSLSNTLTIELFQFENKEHAPNFVLEYEGECHKAMDCNSQSKDTFHSISNIIACKLKHTEVLNKIYLTDTRMYIITKCPHVFAAVGCADVTQPDHSQVARSGDQVSVTCLYSSGAWHLTCSDNQWVGSIGECPGELNAKKHIALPQLFLN